MINGASLTDIATSEQLVPKRVEKMMRDELRKRWIAPVQDYARLQIARLEAIATQLKEKSKNGDLPTIDRLLKVLDRLDRYHGFTKLAALGAPHARTCASKLIVKLGQGARQPAREQMKRPRRPLKALFADLFRLSAAERAKAASRGCRPEEAAELYYDWSLWARPDQIAPEGDWVYWLILAGRGAGKTRTGAETVRAWARACRSST